ncbi:MAG: hypothetical protein CTY39_06565 [Hyphomicrobium sp.]|nr:MAG: hypothetical protein CTY39_06565 [Hyphomicrobium sp.]
MPSSAQESITLTSANPHLPLPRPTIALQHLFLRDLTNSLGLLVPHLDDGDLVTVCDADRNLLASGLNVLGCLDRFIGIFRAGNRNRLGDQTLRAAQFGIAGVLGVGLV